MSHSDQMLQSALIASLSPERLSTYQNVTPDMESALDLYVWNTRMSAALYAPLQCLEVVLRNAISRNLTEYFGRDDWFEDNFFEDLRDRIKSAKEKCLKNNHPADVPHIIAELNFGAWVSLLGKGKKGRYEDLWVKTLYRAFTGNQMRLKRRDIHGPVDTLRNIRNRIAHHEPIFKADINQVHDDIINVCKNICPVTAEWIETQSTVRGLSNSQPSLNDRQHA